MITDLQVQHELLKTALEATDNYLFLEKRAKEAGAATNRMVHDFTYEMSRAHDALQALGVLDKHQDYMEFHVNEMLKLTDRPNATVAEIPYLHVPEADFGEVEEETQVWDKPSPVKNSKKLSSGHKAKAKARAKAAGRPYPNMVDNIWAARQEGKVLSFGQFITEEKKSSEEDKISDEEIDQLVDELTWEDIVDLYDDLELTYEKDDDESEEEDEEELEEEVLDEKLSVQARLKKRQAFARMRGKRNVARNIKLRRASSIEILKKRAVVAARRAVYKRFLRGRDKATLSAAEKDRIEQQVSRMKYMQQAIATKMLPKMRSIEQKRLTGYRTRKSSAPGGTKSKAPGGTKAPKRR